MVDMNDDEDGGGDDRRSIRRHGKHHKTVSPNRWPATSVNNRPGSVLEYHHRRHDALIVNRNGTDIAARTSSHVLHAPPTSMCYTTNEVLVIIAVTCFLNFAFILLIMTCIHCFTDPSHHKKFGAVAYAELGDEVFDTDIIDGETVTLLNPTKSAQDTRDYLYEKSGDLNEYDLESCAPYQNLIVHDHQCKSRRKSEEDLFLFE